jgi:hypothetical protein
MCDLGTNANAGTTLTRTMRARTFMVESLLLDKTKDVGLQIFKLLLFSLSLLENEESNSKVIGFCDLSINDKNLPEFDFAKNCDEKDRNCNCRIPIGRSIHSFIRIRTPTFHFSHQQEIEQAERRKSKRLTYLTVNVAR